jgi:myosin-crossreactive antigen
MTTGDYVKKKMSQTTSEEILTELIGQLGFDDIGAEVLKAPESAFR